MYEVIAYIGALLIGLVLGLIGGGGSILTVPILVYILALDPVVATAYSLFVVGTSSLVGAIRNAQKGMVDFRTAILFALPALSAVYLIRKYFIPWLPETLIQTDWLVLTKNTAILVFFGMIMLLASYSMIKSKSDAPETNTKTNVPLLLIFSALVGIISGLVGAGGGFLIIPALVFLAKLPMKKAVATSLLIIAINSLIGFLGDVQTFAIDWKFLLSFTSLSVVGIFVGIYLTQFIEGAKLKKGFGFFVLAMGIYIVLKEVL